MSEQKGTAVIPATQKAIVKWKGEQIIITFHDVKRLICPLATDQEVAMFLKTCQSLQLNPFANECYLIKFDPGDKAAFVVAIDSYLSAAEVNKNYDGCEAGIILKFPDAPLEFRDGSFLLDGEKSNLVGGWARVYRKDRSRPTYVSVNKAECVRYTREGKPTKFWVEPKQPWMLRKTALKRGLCEAFPSLFAGTLTAAEVGDMEAEFHEMPEGTLRPALEKEGKPDWRKFWARVKSELKLTQEQARDLLKVESLKKDLVDQGYTMEQVWNSLIHALQGSQMAGNVVEPETGEIITPEKEILENEQPPSTELEDELFGEDEGEAGAATREAEEMQPTGVAAPAKPKRDLTSIRSINDLTRACFEDFNLQPNDVYKELGYSSAHDISDTPAECYRKIAAVRE